MRGGVLDPKYTKWQPVPNYETVVQTAWKSPAGLLTEHGDVRRIILSLYLLWTDTTLLP